MWYYEERTALGRWSPRTEPSQPSAVTASGRHRTIRAVREVPEMMTGYDLNVLRDWSDAVIAKETAEAAKAAPVTPEWETMADWSGLPDVYVTSVRRLQGMFWEITAASVPMATVPEVRLVRAKTFWVKPLSWREIDPGHRLVGTGLGFTCEVHHLHKGGWEAIWPLSNAEFPDALAAKAAMEAAYAAMVLSFVEVLA